MLTDDYIKELSLFGFTVIVNLAQHRLMMQFNPVSNCVEYESLDSEILFSSVSLSNGTDELHDIIESFLSGDYDLL